MVTTGILAGSAHTLAEESNVMEMLQRAMQTTQPCKCAIALHCDIYIAHQTSHSVACYAVHVQHNREFGSAQSKIVVPPAM